ncbi:MAG: hypothetical protein D6722_06415, partial [Bacteroidetes bacterium]
AQPAEAKPISITADPHTTPGGGGGDGDGHPGETEEAEDPYDVDDNSMPADDGLTKHSERTEKGFVDIALAIWALILQWTNAVWHFITWLWSLGYYARFMLVIAALAMIVYTVGVAAYVYASKQAQEFCARWSEGIWRISMAAWVIATQNPFALLAKMILGLAWRAATRKGTLSEARAKVCDKLWPPEKVQKRRLKALPASLSNMAGGAESFVFVPASALMRCLQDIVKNAPEDHKPAVIGPEEAYKSQLGVVPPPSLDTDRLTVIVAFSCPGTAIEMGHFTALVFNPFDRVIDASTTRPSKEPEHLAFWRRLANVPRSRVRYSDPPAGTEMGRCAANVIFRTA